MRAAVYLRIAIVMQAPAAAAGTRIFAVQQYMLESFSSSLKLERRKWESALGDGIITKWPFSQALSSCLHAFWSLLQINVWCSPNIMRTPCRGLQMWAIHDTQDRLPRYSPR